MSADRTPWRITLVVARDDVPAILESLPSNVARNVEMAPVEIAPDDAWADTWAEVRRQADERRRSEEFRRAARDGDYT